MYTNIVLASTNHFIKKKLHSGKKLMVTGPSSMRTGKRQYFPLLAAKMLFHRDICMDKKYI